MHACPQTKHRYEYLAANDTHRDQCHTQYQTNPPRHGFLGGSSQELAAACAASADLAAQRRGSPGRTPSSRSCPRAAAEAPVPCIRRHSSKERRKKLAPGPRAASARSAGVNGMPPWRLPIFEVNSRTVQQPRRVPGHRCRFAMVCFGSKPPLEDVFLMARKQLC